MTMDESSIHQVLDTSIAVHPHPSDPDPVGTEDADGDATAKCGATCIEEHCPGNSSTRAQSNPTLMPASPTCSLRVLLRSAAQPQASQQSRPSASQHPARLRPASSTQVSSPQPHPVPPVSWIQALWPPAPNLFASGYAPLRPPDPDLLQDPAPRAPWFLASWLVVSNDSWHLPRRPPDPDSQQDPAYCASWPRSTLCAVFVPADEDWRAVLVPPDSSSSPFLPPPAQPAPLRPARLRPCFRRRRAALLQQPSAHCAACPQALRTSALRSYASVHVPPLLLDPDPQPPQPPDPRLPSSRISALALQLASPTGTRVRYASLGLRYASHHPYHSIHSLPTHQSTSVPQHASPPPVQAATLFNVASSVSTSIINGRALLPTSVGMSCPHLSCLPLDSSRKPDPPLHAGIGKPGQQPWPTKYLNWLRLDFSLRAHAPDPFRVWVTHPSDNTLETGLPLPLGLGDPCIPWPTKLPLWQCLIISFGAHASASTALVTSSATHSRAPLTGLGTLGSLKYNNPNLLRCFLFLCTLVLGSLDHSISTCCGSTPIHPSDISPETDPLALPASFKGMRPLSCQLWLTKSSRLFDLSVFSRAIAPVSRDHVTSATTVPSASLAVARLVGTPCSVKSKLWRCLLASCALAPGPADSYVTTLLAAPPPGSSLDEIPPVSLELPAGTGLPCAPWLTKYLMWCCLGCVPGVLTPLPFDPATPTARPLPSLLARSTGLGRSGMPFPTNPSLLAYLFVPLRPRAPGCCWPYLSTPHIHHPSVLRHTSSAKESDIIDEHSALENAAHVTGANCGITVRSPSLPSHLLPLSRSS